MWKIISTASIKAWRIVKGFFKAYKKLEKLETSMSAVLSQDFIAYQSNPDFQKLHDLMRIVGFMQITGVNGSTQRIQDKIAREFIKVTNERKNILEKENIE